MKDKCGLAGGMAEVISTAFLGTETLSLMRAFQALGAVVGSGACQLWERVPPAVTGATTLPPPGQLDCERETHFTVTPVPGFARG